MILKRVFVMAAGTTVAACALQAPASAAPRAEGTEAAAKCPAARVTGLSVLLDVLTSGSQAGPSVFYGAALAALSQPLPEPFGSAQAQSLAAGAQGVEQFRTEGPQYIDSFRTVIAPFAAGNDVANQGVVAFADGLDAVADAGGKAIAPGDMTLHQFATLVRIAQEKPAAPC